mmetsp:Transcript_12820/g.42805  ORF Transcript_12820/g.42805 Transcript_12820/m.42805 type:complete len:152 (+) Transcript_12820:1839-2294(+)
MTSGWCSPRSRRPSPFRLLRCTTTAASTSPATLPRRAGWGVHVAGFYAFGSWSDATRRAVATLSAAEREGSADSVSISPLELLTSTFLVVLLGMRGVGHFDATAPRNFVGRSDSLSSCSVVNTGRATSKTMFVAYEALLAAQRKYSIQLRL